jgi:aminopeptidase N
MRMMMLLILASAGAIQAQPVPEAGLSQALAEQRARAIRDIEYDLSFRLPAAAEEDIDGRLQLRFTLLDTDQPVVLDFDAAEPRVTAVTSDGREVPFQLANGHIVVPASALRRGSNELHIEFIAGSSPLNRNPDFLYTLFVPDRASNAFPSFDQPDMKAVYRLTLDIPADWEAVSNAPGAEVQNDGARRRIRFQPTRPLSTYLFSFAAGRFQVEEAVREGRAMRMLHRETDTAKVARNRDAIFDLHASALAWLEDYTGIPYPFDKFDFVLVPSFQYGGMEHPGAILYNATRLMLEPSATQNELLGRASLIAHETAHMWFGDLVTMRWFDDVWMKEVFANFMAAKIVNPAFPEIDHDLRFVLAHHPAAYGVDRTAGTHAIRQRLDNLAEAGSLYGAIIYQKAPIVMRQLETLTGVDAFRAGLREYLKEFSYGNATWGDLVTILDRRSTQDLARWSRVWVEEPGRPVIRAVIEQDEGRIGLFALQQEDPAGRGRTWPQRLDVLVGWPDSVRSVPLISDGTLTPVAGVAGLPLPRYVLPDAGGLGYARFALDEATRRVLGDSLFVVEPPVARAAALIALHDAMLEGEVEPHMFMQTLVSAVEGESTQLLTERYLALMADVYWRFLPQAGRERLAPRLEALLWGGLSSAPDASAKAAWFAAVRGMATGETSVERLRAIWAGSDSVPGLPLAERDYTALAQALALREVPDADMILRQQLERIDNPDRRARLEFIIPAFSRDDAVRDAFFESLRDVRNRSHEPWVLDGLAALAHPLRAHHAVKYIRPGLELLPEIQRTGDIFFPRRWVDALLSGHSSPDASAEVEAFLAASPALAPRLQAIVLQAADDLFRSAGLGER